MHATDEAGVVRLVADGAQIDRVPVGLEDDGRAADRKLPDAALAQAAADHDALRVLPFLESQETPDDRGELLRELFDGALDDAGRFGVAIGQHLVELLLAEVFSRLIAERIL